MRLAELRRLRHAHPELVFDEFAGNYYAWKPGPDGDEADMYGGGGVLAELEAEIAELLGKPAAAFMPSGIMAQQCVLRVWSDRQASKRVAVHALSHLVMHELSALETLHDLEVEHLTSEPRPPTVDDLAALPGRLGAVSIELPQRDAAHRLPEWDELVAFALPPA